MVPFFLSETGEDLLICYLIHKCQSAYVDCIGIQFFWILFVLLGFSNLHRNLVGLAPGEADVVTECILLIFLFPEIGTFKFQILNVDG